jgi:hypothetical protein
MTAALAQAEIDSLAWAGASGELETVEAAIKLAGGLEQTDRTA